MREIVKNVIDWGQRKNLIKKENAPQQFRKFLEEVDEVKDDFYELINNSIDFKDTDNLKLEIGDVQVTLIILCEQLGINYDECLELAHQKIKNRTGKTINGAFVKD